MGNTNLQFVIGYGLPGSGKTTELNRLLESAKFDAKRKGKVGTTTLELIDIDSIVTSNTTQEKKDKEINIKLDVSWCTGRRTTDAHIFVDGLFTTNDDLINIISRIKKCNEDYSVINVTVVYWNCDREACIWNDEGRRNSTSRATIENLPYEVPDKKRIEEAVGQKVMFIRKTVVKKAAYHKDLYAIGQCAVDNKYLHSSEWSMGGRIESWDGYTSAVLAETPKEFVELDNLLENVCPNLTFLQYKRIFRECVTTEEYYEPDYYGGGIRYGYYRCDLDILYEILDSIKGE